MSASLLIVRIRTGLTKGKHQFTLHMIGKDGMKKTARRKHGAFDQAKIGGDIVEVLGDDLRMADNRSCRLITPRI